MTHKSGSSQACAACKFQRRRCQPECPLAPYFPPDQPKMFQNAHKLFGVSNILKILKTLDPEQKRVAMNSIIIQANIRDRYPVNGCLEIIWYLRNQILYVEEELQAVHAQLEMYRQHHQISSSLPDDVPSQLELGMASASNGVPLMLFDHSPQNCNAAAIPALPIAQQQCYSNDNGYNSSYMDTKDNVASSLWVQLPYGSDNDNNNNNSMAIQSQLVDATQQLAIQQEVVNDYDEMHPFFDTIDDRQSYIDSKQAYESSSEESLKDTTQSIEHVAENELKTAAACFTLTSVN